MTKIEIKFVRFIRKNILPLTAILVSVLALVLRYCGKDFESDDFRDFLNSWWTVIDSGDITGLASQVGNYNIPYQIIIYIMTLLPFGALHSYKMLSIMFDFVLAFSAGALTYSFVQRNRYIKAVAVYSAVLLLPTVILNSAFWAQCDSIYASFVLLGLLFLHREKPIFAFVFFGAAFAFKLQTVFIFPFLLYYWLLNRKISIFHFFIIPLADVVLCLPALILGRSPADLISIYVQQTDYGKLIQMNYPNFYAFMCDGDDSIYYYLFKYFSVAFTFAVLGLMLALFIYKKVDLKNTETFLLTAAWTVFTCLMFLSSMHERYAYLLDIILIIYSVVTLKRFWLPCAAVLISLRGYCYYLFDNYEVFGIQTAAVLNTVLYICVTVILFKQVMSGQFTSCDEDAKKISN